MFLYSSSERPKGTTLFKLHHHAAGLPGSLTPKAAVRSIRLPLLVIQILSTDRQAIFQGPPSDPVEYRKVFHAPAKSIVAF